MEVVKANYFTFWWNFAMKILGNTLQKILTSLEWGRQHEFVAFEMFKQKRLRENPEIVNKWGLWISPEHLFLGASPDAAIYDPTEKEPYGFAEIKCSIQTQKQFTVNGMWRYKFLLQTYYSEL